MKCRYFFLKALEQGVLFRQAIFYQILMILAIAMLLPLSGCSNSQKTSEDSKLETATVQAS